MIILRLFVVSFAFVSIGWGFQFFSTFLSHAPIESVARRVIAGDPIKSDAQRRLLPALAAIESESVCRPSALRSVAIIRFLLLGEIVASGQRKSIDDEQKALASLVRRSLVCSPADPFLWLMYYWLESTINGFKAEYLKYLAMSYTLGPNEGWIGLRRAPLAFAALSQLPPNVREAAVKEFAAAVEWGAFNEMAAVLTGSGWAARDELLAALKDIPERPRQNFYDTLYRAGFDVDIPGILRRDPRPWR
jgi:hypothetical protein